MLYISQLFDYYGDLLTDKQQEYFKDYYFNNLTLSEISENNEISRNAVHKQIKDAEIKLEFYESKLHLNDKNKKIIKLLEEIKEEKLKEKIKEIL